MDMKSPEFITHGTSSKEDAKKIELGGFKAQEGRATVSADLIYSFEWATEQGRRKGSKSGSEVTEGEAGRMVILKVPEDKQVDRATHTELAVDNENKELTGYSLKYISGRKQLGIYPEGDVVQKRKEIEEAKKEIAGIRQDANTYLASLGIDVESIKSKEDLIHAIKPLDIEQQIDVLKKAEEYEKNLKQARSKAESPIDIGRENVLMSIIPSPELGTKLENLKNQIYALEKVDFEQYASDLATIIETNKDNFLAAGIDVWRVMRTMLESTTEAEVMNMIRSLSVDVKRANGYTVFNRGGDKIVEKAIDKDQLRQKLERIKSTVESENFDIGMENLNRYIRININLFLEELK